MPARPDRGDERAQGRRADHPGRRERLLASGWTISVAPYLIAIARRRPRLPVARAAHRRLDRAGDARRAAAELADTEKMVEAAEKLYGPYRWGRYDLLVLPPAFPYGGMENPTLTFLTPTFIAGDKSLVGLVAHELAHSWSGNLVTNATGPTAGSTRASPPISRTGSWRRSTARAAAAQEAALSFDDMTKALAEEGADAPVTRLHLAESGSRPGRRRERDRLRQGRDLPAHDRADRRPRAVRRLSALLLRPPRLPADDLGAISSPICASNLIKGDKALEAKLQLDDWVYQPGLPANVARPDPAAFAAVDKAVAAFAGGGAAAGGFSGSWTTAERLRFLNKLPRKLPQAAPRRSSIAASKLERRRQ